MCVHQYSQSVCLLCLICLCITSVIYFHLLSGMPVCLSHDIYIYEYVLNIYREAPHPHSAPPSLFIRLKLAFRLHTALVYRVWGGVMVVGVPERDRETHERDNLARCLTAWRALRAPKALSVDGRLCSGAQQLCVWGPNVRACPAQSPPFPHPFYICQCIEKCGLNPQK